MGDCVYCGKPAGLFRQKHKECEHKQQLGTQRILSLAQQAMRTGGDLPALEETVRRVASASLIKPDAVRGLLIQSWDAAVRAVLEDGILSADEEAALVKAKDHFHWTQDDLDHTGAYMTLAKGSALRDLLEGSIPRGFRAEGQIPFNLQRGEQLIWGFSNVKYYEVRASRSFVGGYQGASVRVARGVYYRLGGFRGAPVIGSEAVHADTGALGITEKHLYFAGPAKSFRVRYDKIVSFTPYSDGFGFQRDAASAKPQGFLTGDGWFSYNLVTNLANLHAGRGPSVKASGEAPVRTAADVGGDDDLEDAFALPIVGESKYQPALEAICGGRDEDGTDKVVDAVLVLEDSNPYDPQAVRVDIAGRTVGYLSRANAREFRESRARAGETASVIACKARIKGGWDRGAGDRGNFGVWLDATF